MRHAIGHIIGFLIFVAGLLLVSLGALPGCKRAQGDTVSYKTDASVPLPAASLASGQYDGVGNLTVSLEADEEIRYTLDGSIPDASSRKYRSPVKLKKTTVIRAVSIGRDGSCSPAATYTYLINEGHQMDVICLASDPKGLFSTQTGIYATGPYRLKPSKHKNDDKPGLAYPYKGANFWQKWWREANVSFLPREGEGFSADCETAIFGGYSRTLAKKSFKFKFDGTCGPDRLRYRLFPNRDSDEYKSFVVRAGSDAFGTLIKDDLVACLADGLMDISATRPAVLYINGRYFGIYFIREKINKHFIAGHYGIPTGSLDIIFGNRDLEDGSTESWNDLASFVRSHDITQDAVYQYVADRIDVQEYADWLVTEIWCDNRDIGNVRCFKSPFLDNKWHWILYDVDRGFMAPDSDFFLNLLMPDRETKIWVDPFRCLLKNPAFREVFLSRLEYQMTTLYNKERVHGAINHFVDEIGPEMKRNMDRWKRSYPEWEEAIAGLHRFADERQPCLKQLFATHPFLQDLLHMSPAELERCFPD